MASRVADRLLTLKSELPAGIELVAVSKFQPLDRIREAYEAGQRIFGESRVQELLDKIPQLPADITWHFIGHLQTNKVRQLIGHTALIESVDSERLIDIIDTESRRKDLLSKILMQVHVAAEETKFGFSREEIISYFKERKFESLTNTHICGIMAMATNTEDETTIRRDFAETASIFREIKEITGNSLRGFETLSMGMSGDWPLAVEEGATMIRVGSSIFGARY